MINKKIAIIIGAGIAGISCAYELVKNNENIKPIIIDSDSCIGGLAKTLNYDEHHADIGPHRFFSKDETVLNFWKDIMPLQGSKALDDIILGRDVEYKNGIANPETDDNVLLKRRRFSRIYYLKKFFDYPVKLNMTTIKNLGLWRMFLCGISYIKSCFFKRKEITLEDFMINRFGKELYSTFFEFYTEKVWGRKPKHIGKEWGEQRIKGLSLLKTILNKFSIKKETSLVEEYLYPKFGAAQICEEMLKTIIEKGGEIHLNSKVISLKKENDKIVSVTVQNKNGTYAYYGDYIISSMPVKDLICGMNDVPADIYTAAEGLPYRDYQLVSYLVKDFLLKNNTEWKTINNICPDSWIYIQDRDVKIGRIYIPKNFSPYMSPNINDALICLEYFCSIGDELWEMNDDDIFKFGVDELIKINALKDKNDILKSYRLKVEKAYPAYFDTYKDFDKIKNYINTISNLYCIGRNGQHKYNNMDHSTLSGIVCADVLLNKKDKNLLWEVNTEQSYQETK